MTDLNYQDSEDLRSLPSPSVIEQGLMSDPYPMLARLRAAIAAYHNPHGSRWYVTRQVDIDALLRDSRFGKDPRKSAQGTLLSRTMGAMSQESLSMLWLDPPDHTRLRQLVTRSFTRSAVEEWRPRIQEITDSLLDNVTNLDRFDLVEMLAASLPGRVIAEILGVDLADLPKFGRWSDELIGSDPLSRQLAASDDVTITKPFLSQEERMRMHEAEVNVTAYFHKVMEERRTAPRHDLISRLVAAQSSNHQVSDSELAGILMLLLVAGNSTTEALIANGVLALLEHENELRKLQAYPSLITRAVTEILRYDAPVLSTTRIPLVDVVIGGCPITAGQTVTVMLAAANRDPAFYPNPDTFDITRRETHHYSFGGGLHYCLGAQLAQIEAEIAIGALIRRFPTLHLDSDKSPKHWTRPANRVRQLLSLPLAR